MKIYHIDTLILDLDVDDNSYRYRAIKGEHTITLYFALDEHVEIPVGATCEFENETYTLFKPENLKMEHSRKFEYTVVFDAEEAKAARWKFRNPVDGRLKFSLTAKPVEHLQMFVDNMNQRDGGGWTVGRYIDAPEKTISYNHAFCSDALVQIGDAFETEYEYEKVNSGIGKQVSIGKVEHNRDNPLPLSYGRGNGFKPGVGRSNFEDSVPIEILYVQSGERNIDASKYGSRELLLPKSQNISFDGQYFEDEDGFDSIKARAYQTDAAGFSIRRSDKALSSLVEDSLDCSEIYPSRVGTISSVVEVDESKNFYDIVDEDIPESLNFTDCLIDGETMTIIPQSGMLAGKEFEVKYIHEATGGKAARRFEIVPQEIDGQTMPGGVFVPNVGDTYAVFHCMLPDAYISDNATKSGASWDMFRKGVKYLYDNEEQKFSFTGELNGIWAKKDWLNIGGRILLGGFVLFSDERFQQEGVAVRIVGIKDYINKPHSPEIELSNSPVSSTVSSTLKKIESNEVVVEDLHNDAISFTKRRYRDAQETITMLDNAMLENFTESIAPATVRAMMVFLGSQFRFVTSMTDLTPTTWDVSLNQTTQQLTAPSGVIQRIVSGTNSVGESKVWALPEITFARMTDASASYYLYAKVSATDTTGEFIISPTAIAIDGVSGYYHLLVGILNSEYNGERSYAPLVGYTEILPGMVRTDRIVSQDGKTYFDLLQNEIAGRIMFRDGLLSGLIGIGNDNGVNAGMSGAGGGTDSANLPTDVRLWAGAEIGQRDTAPFRVLHDGSFVASDAIILGSVRSPFVGQSAGATIEPDKNGNVYLSAQGNYSYTLLWDESQNGRTINIVMNGTGFATITAPSGKQFYVNGKREGFITLSREIVTMMGFSSSSVFGGWIVIGREDFIPNELYGRPIKAMCYGRVSGNSSMSSTPTAMADADYACFDDYYNQQAVSEDGTLVHRSKLKVARMSQGVYRVYFPSGDHSATTPVEDETQGWNIGNLNGGGTFTNGYIVICTGGGTVFTSVTARTNTYFEVRCADDASANDGEFYFEMINLGGWI